MKKLIALLLCVCMLGAPLCVSAFATPLSAGDDALKAEFRSGSGGGLDYRYFAPAVQSGVKYPLVVWLHGVASGNYAGDQIDSYDICKWVSDEYQARFANAASTRGSFNTLKDAAADKSKVRFTAVSQAVTPSGASVGTQHYMWRIFTNDMFMADGSQYACSTTVDGTGATISFTHPNGIISWLSQQSKQTQQTAAPRQSIFDRIADFFRMIVDFFRNLFT